MGVHPENSGWDVFEPDSPAQKIASLSAMDDPDNLDTLKDLGELAAAQQVQDEDLDHHFDLRALGRRHSRRLG